MSIYNYFQKSIYSVLIFAFQKSWFITFKINKFPKNLLSICTMCLKLNEFQYIYICNAQKTLSHLYIQQNIGLLKQTKNYPYILRTCLTKRSPTGYFFDNLYRKLTPKQNIYSLFLVGLMLARLWFLYIWLFNPFFVLTNLWHRGQRWPRVVTCLASTWFLAADLSRQRFPHCWQA